MIGRDHSAALLCPKNGGWFAFQSLNVIILHMENQEWEGAAVVVYKRIC